ncbi:unnamed protein product [Protopolystoma xenopodis]|uniref:RGS domain-containing protein n=1 Tax=Protopolystoma xenopodis TaxID=117903 RepID=A0A3S5APS4_9PLAT|nr:unnamed protein product [Protopolystoma xenopodis]
MMIMMVDAQRSLTLVEDNVMNNNNMSSLCSDNTNLVHELISSRQIVDFEGPYRVLDGSNIAMQKMNCSTLAAYCRWSSGLDRLLEDSDGIVLFHKFLSSKHSLGHLLDFWFACKGFRSNIDPNDSAKLFQVAKIIYRKYLRSESICAVPVSSSTKRSIVEQMSLLSSGKGKYRINRSLFDTAQADTKSLLVQKYYPEFIQSTELWHSISNSNKSQDKLSSLSMGQTLWKDQQDLLSDHTSSTSRNVNNPWQQSM